jgi:hypothetical protein
MEFSLEALEHEFLGERGPGMSRFKFAGKGLGEIVSALIPYFFTAAGILLLLYLLVGGIQLMLSGGDPKAMQDAKSKITNAFVGFLIVFTAYWLAQIVGNLLGLEQSSFGELF